MNWGRPPSPQGYIVTFFFLPFLASQDALEVMRVTYLLTYWVSVSIDLTDVTLVSEDTCGDEEDDGEDEDDEKDENNEEVEEDERDED